MPPPPFGRRPGAWPVPLASARWPYAGSAWPAQRRSLDRGTKIPSWTFSFSLPCPPKTAAMGKNERWKCHLECHLECHLMSGDFEDNDQYTSTIDDNLTKGKVVMSSLSVNNRKSKA